jgi:hypothetical protein
MTFWTIFRCVLLLVVVFNLRRGHSDSVYMIKYRITSQGNAFKSFKLIVNHIFVVVDAYNRTMYDYILDYLYTSINN